MIALRLRSGRQVKAARGGYAFGAPPYGWTAVDGELVPDPAEQSVLEYMHLLRDRGTSLDAIATLLNNNAMKPKRGDRWHAQTVSRALARRPAVAAS